MSTTTTVERMRTVFEAFIAAESAHDPDAAAACFTTDAIYEIPSFGIAIAGRRALREFFAANFAADPELRPLPAGVAFGDDVCVYWGNGRRSVNSDFMGTTVERPGVYSPLGMAVLHFRDGLIEREISLADVLSMCREAGVSADALLAAGRAMEGLE
jgi:hypothetical protein